MGVMQDKKRAMKIKERNKDKDKSKDLNVFERYF